LKAAPSPTTSKSSFLNCFFHSFAIISPPYLLFANLPPLSFPPIIPVYISSASRSSLAPLRLSFIRHSTTHHLLLVHIRSFSFSLACPFFFSLSLLSSFAKSQSTRQVTSMSATARFRSSGRKLVIPYTRPRGSGQAFYAHPFAGTTPVRVRREILLHSRGVTKANCGVVIKRERELSEDAGTRKSQLPRSEHRYANARRLSLFTIIARHKSAVLTSVTSIECCFNLCGAINFTKLPTRKIGSSSSRCRAVKSSNDRPSVTTFLRGSLGGKTHEPLAASSLIFMPINNRYNERCGFVNHL